MSSSICKVGYLWASVSNNTELTLHIVSTSFFFLIFQSNVWNGFSLLAHTPCLSFRFPGQRYAPCWRVRLNHPNPPPSPRFAALPLHPPTATTPPFRCTRICSSTVEKFNFICYFRRMWTCRSARRKAMYRWQRCPWGAPCARAGDRAPAVGESTGLCSALVCWPIWQRRRRQ